MSDGHLDGGTVSPPHGAVQDGAAAGGPVARPPDPAAAPPPRISPLPQASFLGDRYDPAPRAWAVIAGRLSETYRCPVTWSSPYGFEAVIGGRKAGPCGLGEIRAHLAGPRYR